MSYSSEKASFSSTIMTDHDDNTSFNVGVLILPNPQLLDLGSIDLFGMLSTTYLDACPLPPSLRSLAHPNINIRYINAAGSTSALAECTADLTIRTTHKLSSPEVLPGELDVLLVPGPEPGYQQLESERDFIRAHVRDPRAVARNTVVMTVCTGVFPAAYAGILGGRRATGPRALLGDLRRQFPETEWTERRWEQSRDGRVWTSAGITNGLDMVAAYLHSPHARANGVSPILADLVCRMADVGTRSRKYDTGNTRHSLATFWLVLRSLLSRKNNNSSHS